MFICNLCLFLCLVSRMISLLFELVVYGCRIQLLLRFPELPMQIFFILPELTILLLVLLEFRSEKNQ